MAGIAALTGPDEPVRSHERNLPHAARSPGRRAQRDRRHLVPVPGGRVLRISQRLDDHRRRSRAGEVLVGRRRCRMRRRLLVRCGRQRLFALLVRGIARGYRLGAPIDSRDVTEVQRLTLITAGSHRLIHVSFIARLTSAKTPAAMARARAVPSAMMRSTSAGSSR